jgi:hypothetical protein
MALVIKEVARLDITGNPGLNGVLLAQQDFLVYNVKSNSHFLDTIHMSLITNGIPQMVLHNQHKITLTQFGIQLLTL